jgi:hypothetical protein
MPAWAPPACGTDRHPFALDAAASRAHTSSLQLRLGYNCAYVLVEWDPGKARLNLTKHRVSFADAVIALEDNGALTVPDPSSEEERWVTMGLDGVGRLLVV